MNNLNELQQIDEILIAQKMLTLGNKYIVADVNNNVLLYSKQKMFKLKEDFRFYLDEKMTQEALKITTSQIIDFSGKYQVIDSQTNQIIGYAKREGWKSLIQGKWRLLDNSEQEIATVEEESTVLALLRRFVDFMTLIIPVKFVIAKDGAIFGEIQKKRTFIRDRYYIDLRKDSEKKIDRRLAVALAILLDSINSQ